jgi:glycerophosphoryl diester phosphodiesterase
MFVGGGEKIYEGMIIGENAKQDDLDVNPMKAKQLTNVRASGKDEAIRLTPPRRPTLEQAIAVVPPDMPLFLDLKQKPAAPVVTAVADVLRRTGAAGRTTIYSTDADVTDLAVQQQDLTVAESRDLTRKRLLNVALAHRCDPPPHPQTWAGFELHRELTVTEQFTLGTGVSAVVADLWDPESLGCFTSQPGARVIGFAVNSEDDYRLAAKIGMDAVLVDSPRSARDWHG